MDLEGLLKQNAMLAHDNQELNHTVQQLSANIAVLRRHNTEKNREVELLLQNSLDSAQVYNSPYGEHSLGSVKYSISSNPHPRVI